MRIVGYVREGLGPEQGETAFGQSEHIRRWVNRNGYHLLAICQDAHSPNAPLDREGFRAVLGIVATGQVDAVVVPSLETFSGDKIVQEVMLGDLRQRGASVTVTQEDAIETLAEPSSDPARLIIRDVLEQVQRHRDQFAPGKIRQTAPEVDQTEAAPEPALGPREVLIELIPAGAPPLRSVSA